MGAAGGGADIVTGTLTGGEFCFRLSGRLDPQFFGGLFVDCPAEGGDFIFCPRRKNSTHPKLDLSGRGITPGAAVDPRRRRGDVLRPDEIVEGEGEDESAVTRRSPRHDGTGKDLLQGALRFVVFQQEDAGSDEEARLLVSLELL